MKPSRIVHLVLNTSDLPRAEHFYCDVLGFEVVNRLERPRGVFLTLGSQHHDLALFELADPAAETRAIVPGLHHFALKLEDRDSFPVRVEDMRLYPMEEVDAILRADLARFERGVSGFCPVPLTQGQFDALVSFSFNVGLGTLQRSTLRQKVLRGDMEGAAKELLKYCMAGGKVLKGLQNRRIDERALFLS